MAPKSNAARKLDAAGIAYELVAYDLGDCAFSAEAVAEVIGVAAREVFKTLVVEGDRNGPCFAVIPAGTRLDLKALGAASGDRKLRLVPLSDVRSLTGYERGAVTVLNAKRAFPVYVDASAVALDRMGVSGGAKGLEIVLAPADYLAVTDAVTAAIGRIEA